LWKVWEPLAVGWFAAAMLVFRVLTAMNIREEWRDPLVIVARVTGGVLGTELASGEDIAKGLLSNWLMYGYTRVLSVEIETAHRLKADGTLGEDAAKARETEIGARRLVHRWVVPHARCVLLCSGSGAALAQVADVTLPEPARAVSAPAP
jgi:hypothetical protein